MTLAPEFIWEITAVVLGLVTGSFLNVLALRSLSGESIFWPPSHCTQCRHRLSPLDNIPLLSYLLLKGQCRYCLAKISWQYPVVEAVCALMFLIFVKTFGATWYCLGMLAFGCTLIAVCITDFREKLIPHDITYPSLVMGILFSSLVRHDALGSMAGVGASYILFDFLAHYGLKVYMAVRVADKSNSEEAEGEDKQWQDQAVDEVFQLEDGSAGHTKLDEFEVMGGGDAVLSAVISAWLGWQRLVVAIAIGFLAGTIMGVFYLIKEMRVAGILHECLRPTLIGMVIGFVAMSAPMYFLSHWSGHEFPWLSFGVLGLLGGALLGIVSVGTRVSKPFPFGPALALGAFVSIFWDPIGWLLHGGA